MKITFAFILYNEDRLIKAQLERLYDLAHEIIICEGLVLECKHAWTEKRDNTIEIIKSFPDPRNKIKLISKDDWPGKEHMVREYWAKSTGDYVWHIDADEFYTNRCMVDTIKYIEKTKQLQYGHEEQFYYYKYTNVVVESGNKTFWNKVGRIHKCDKSYTLTHRPQSLHKNGHWANVTFIKTGRQHHYSMMDHTKTTSKLKFYSVETKRYCDVFEMPIEHVLKNKLHVRINSTIRKLRPDEIEVPEGISQIYKALQ